VVPVLDTPRLRLRQWRAEDRPPFAAMNADPEVMAFFPAPLSIEASDALADRLARELEGRGYGLWAVEARDQAPFLGFVGLQPVGFDAPFTPAVEIGWRLARPFWGHGYATEAAAAVLDRAFGPLGLDQVVSFASAGNRRSVAVMVRLGLRHDPAGDFDHPRLVEGDRLRPHVLYRTDAERWRTR
jgi:RimJ/RimL family protein N-acetyltransferase